MRSSFFGLNIAIRGLDSAQRNLDTINHNLNNITTPGYSRQVAVQAAAQPMGVWDGTGMVGTGSEVTGVERIRDNYLDFKYWSENVASGEWAVKAEMMGEMELTFNEPSDNGYNEIMSSFFDSLQDLSKDPSSMATRAVVKENAVTLTKYFNSLATRFEELQSNVNDDVKTKVDQVNSLGEQIESLNRQIYITELDGSSANDLRDQRGVLVDELSHVINIEANEVVAGKLPDGRDDVHFVITISGKAFVDHFSSRDDKSGSLSKLTVVQREDKLNEEDIPNLYDVEWEDGNSLEIRGGELKGYLDIRDGNSGQVSVSDPTVYSPEYNGIPNYINKLNQFVQTFAMAFNEGIINADGNDTIDASDDTGFGHIDGYDLDSVAGDAASGIRFFTILGSNDSPEYSDDFIDGASSYTDIQSRYANITAKNFTVSADIIEDVTLISASNAAGEVGNNEEVLALMNYRNDTNMFAQGSPDDYMKALIAGIGVDAQQAIRLSDNQETITDQLDTRRTSISGVSIDEEMANLVKFQQTYNACAKMITTMSEVLDTLINRMGV